MKKIYKCKTCGQYTLKKRFATVGHKKKKIIRRKKK